MPSLKLADLKLTQANGLDPGTFVLASVGGTPNTVMAVTISGGRVIGQNLLMPLAGARAFNAFPMRDQVRCVVLPIKDVVVEISRESPMAGDVHAMGAIVLCDGAAYVSVQLVNGNFADDSVVNLQTWTLEEYLPPDNRRPFGHYRVSAIEESTGERLLLWGRDPEPQ